MVQIKQLKDTTGNFYPVTHKDAIVGIEDIQVDMTGYATEQWVKDQNYLTEHQDISNKVDVSEFEETNQVVSAALNDLNDNKQDKTDTSLETENKTIVGAINEVNSKCEGSSVDLSNYLPLTGGTMIGTINFDISDNSAGWINFVQSDAYIKPAEQTGLVLFGDGAEFKLYQNEIVANCNVSASAFYETSDARKKDIKSDLSLNKCYDLIDKCQTVIYSLKDQTKEQVGMIAQEIEQFFPEVVATDEEGFKSLAYDRLVVICFKVLKDIIKRLNHIENIL